MNIRAAAPVDSEAVRTILRQAFGQDAEADLVEALRESGDVVTELVADEGGQIVGHILLSELQSPDRCVALAPVSVQSDFQGRGIGSALIREAIERAKSGGWLAMILLGEPDYYSRFGFSVGACAKLETSYPKDYMMALELRPGSLAKLHGNLAYPAAFDQVS